MLKTPFWNQGWVIKDKGLFFLPYIFSSGSILDLDFLLKKKSNYESVLNLNLKVFF